MALELTSQNFDQEIKKFPGVALVDFWAVWCTPCKIQGPIIEAIAEEFKDNNNVKIAKMDVDQHADKAQEYEILSIPTLKIFKNGQVVDELIGLNQKDNIIATIKKHL